MCADCGAEVVMVDFSSLNHQITSTTSFLDVPMEVPPEMDLAEITVVIVAKKDGKPWACGLKLLARGELPNNPTAN